MNNFDKEKQEAVDAGYRTLNSLKKARDHLKKAKNWGTWDILGGGIITTIGKHSCMEQAKWDMEEAKSELESFSRELRNISISCNLSFDISDFLSFADIFLDSLIVEWMVQEQIHRTYENVEKAVWHVQAAIRELEHK